ncbi:formate dehydrogenase accessory sulfurtransferase FdhD [Puniceicoccaceae bacterium K14]|nr:formate dehydrogenase accessory sulfurtransferase FdhD [Puniceicoccaceae bacterium K14]
MPLNPSGNSIASVSSRILRYSNGNSHTIEDRVVVEEPLEMGLKTESEIANIGVTMRTPGDDKNLVLGFLLCEGIIRRIEDVRSVTFKEEKDATLPAMRSLIQLVDPSTFDSCRFSRAFPISAACGACGKSALETLRVFRKNPLPYEGAKIDAEFIQGLGTRLVEEQSIFTNTGGLHAAARLNFSGEFLGIKEDIGRHNALDKLIGETLESGLDGWGENVLLLSGRVGFDLIQKAIIVGCPIVISIGAPSSLVVELANFFKVTLVGFLKDTRFNVYSAPERIRF